MQGSLVSPCHLPGTPAIPASGFTFYARFLGGDGIGMGDYLGFEVCWSTLGPYTGSVWDWWPVSGMADSSGEMRHPKRNAQELREPEAL
jgi:hypothetical protein